MYNLDTIVLVFTLFFSEITNDALLRKYVTNNSCYYFIFVPRLKKLLDVHRGMNVLTNWSPQTINCLKLSEVKKKNKQKNPPAYLLEVPVAIKPTCQKNTTKISSAKARWSEPYPTGLENSFVFTMNGQWSCSFKDEKSFLKQHNTKLQYTLLFIRCIARNLELGLT